jgi:hypothetical protein
MLNYQRVNNRLTHIIPSLVASFAHLSAKQRFKPCKAKRSDKRRAFSQPLSCAKFTQWTLGQACFPERVKLCNEVWEGHDAVGIPIHGHSMRAKALLVRGLMQTYGK